MNENILPEEFAIVIEQEEKIRARERQKLETEAQNHRETCVQAGAAYVNQWLSEKIALVPEILKPYFSYIRDWREISEFYAYVGDRILKGKDGDSGISSEIMLMFEVPGLAPIGYMALQNKYFYLEAQLNTDDWSDNYLQVEWKDWRNAFHFVGKDQKRPLESLFLAARISYEHYETLLAEKEKINNETKRRQEVQESESPIEQAAVPEQKPDESQEFSEIIQFLKHDRAAMTLVKSFMAICDERAAFESMLSE